MKNSTMNSVMVDLETLGTTPGSIVLSIGAVKFDLTTGEIGETFYQAIDEELSTSLGLTKEPETVTWWNRQSEEARKVFTDPNRVGPEFALMYFSKFFRGSEVIWGNGATFDNVILEAVYRACNKPIPWKFWNSLCYRTVKTLAPELGLHIPLERAGTHHNALDDAITQARHMCAIWKALREREATV